MLQHNSLRLTKNNFDLLRLLFASTVCLVHACELSGYQKLGWITYVLSSGVAIRAFFVISGFLVFMSFERSSSIATYAGKRFRRIYPAYFSVVMLCAIGLLVVSSKDVGSYFSLTWVKYVLANLTYLNFLQPTLPGVFESNKIAAINGALWTLKVEVMFYLSVPLFVYLFRRFGCLPVLALAYCASIAYPSMLMAVAERTGSGMYAELGRQLPGQLSYFMSGAFLYYFLPLFERRTGYFLGAASMILVANTFYPLSFLEPFALAIVVVFFGLFLYIGNIGKYGDYSYGIYLIHFPVIQLLLQTGWFQENPWYFLMTVILITTTGAFAMWHLVEKRFLLRKNHYIAATLSSDKGAPNRALNSDVPNNPGAPVKLNVLIVTGRYPPQPCGIGDHTCRLAARLGALGHRVYVLTSVPPDSGKVSIEHQENIEITRGMVCWNYSAYRKIRHFIEQKHIELLHIQFHTHSFDCHPMITLLPALLKRHRSPLRVVITMHEFAGPMTSLLPGPARRFWLLPLMVYADAVIVTNERDLSYLRWAPFLKRKLRYIPFASHIEPAKGIDAQSARRRIGIDDGEVLVVRFGFVNNVRVSLLPELFHAVKRLVDRGYPVKLLLIGGESTQGRAEVSSLAGTLGIGERVITKGYCSPSEVSEYLFSADIGVQPYPEGICEKRTGLLAALSHGLPIVCFQRGHVPSMFHHKENVMLVPLDDAEHLAAAMEELIISEDLRNTLRQNALKTAASFSWERIGQETDTLYQLLQRQV